MQLTDFNCNLPHELIARYPLPERSASRLLTLNKQTGNVGHHHFHELLHQLNPGDLLVFNNTKVIPARLFGKKASGGKVELLIERIINESTALAHIKASRAPTPNTQLYFENFSATVLERDKDLFKLHVNDSRSVLTLLEGIDRGAICQDKYAFLKYFLLI